MDRADGGGARARPGRRDRRDRRPRRGAPRPRLRRSRPHAVRGGGPRAARGLVAGADPRRGPDPDAVEPARRAPHAGRGRRRGDRPRGAGDEPVADLRGRTAAARARPRVERVAGRRRGPGAPALAVQADRRADRRDGAVRPGGGPDGAGGPRSDTSRTSTRCGPRCGRRSTTCRRPRARSPRSTRIASRSSRPSATSTTHATIRPCTRTCPPPRRAPRRGARRAGRAPPPRRAAARRPGRRPGHAWPQLADHRSVSPAGATGRGSG